MLPFPQFSGRSRFVADDSLDELHFMLLVYAVHASIDDGRVE